MGRRSGPRPVIRTFKKIINIIPASYGAGFSNVIFAEGKDGAAANQTSATDNDVPTGCLIKTVTIQFAAVNLVAAAAFLNLTIQYKLTGQSFIDPGILGGHTQRNQVFFQKCVASGLGQNVNFQKTFKVPKGFQRIREGMQWSFTWSNSASVSAIAQVIYKFQQ